MDLDFLLNPWVISIIIIVFIVGNLASMKYLGQSNLVRKNPNKKSDLDKLIEIFKEKDTEDTQEASSKSDSEESKTAKNRFISFIKNTVYQYGVFYFNKSEYTRLIGRNAAFTRIKQLLKHGAQTL